MSQLPDLFAPPPPPAEGDALLRELLGQTFAKAKDLFDQDVPAELSEEVNERFGQILYDQSDLESTDTVDASGYLVDVGEFERNMVRPILPDASEFAREKLAEAEEMRWLADVETVLVAPHSDDYDAQLSQFRSFMDVLESEAEVLEDRWFLRKHVIPYTPRPAIAVDTETTGLDLRTRYDHDGRLKTDTLLVGIGFAPHPNKGYYLPVRHTGEDGVSNWRPDVIAAGMKELVSRFLCVYHRSRYDLEVLALNGVTGLPPFPYFLDTMLLSYIRDINAPQHGLKLLSGKLLRRPMIEISDLFKGRGGVKKGTYIAFEWLSATQAEVYGVSDVMNTIGLLRFFLAEPKDVNIFLTQELQISLDHQIVYVLRSMARTGLPVNLAYLYFALKDALYRKQLMQSEIDRVAGETVNVRSGPQLTKLLFGKCKVEPLPGMKKGKKGDYSLDEKALAKLHAAYPELEVLDLIVRFRKISDNIAKIYSKLLTNSWVDAFLPWTRVQIEFGQTSTSTGRFASSGNKGKRRVTAKLGKGKKPKMSYVPERGGWEASVNAQGLPAKIQYRTARARQIKRLPPGAGVDLDNPYPPEVEREFIAVCAGL